MNKLTRTQWEELNAQLSSTSTEPEAEDVPGEHWKLIALLNRFGFHPVSKREALQLAENCWRKGGWRKTKSCNLYGANRALRVTPAVRWMTLNAG